MYLRYVGNVRNICNLREQKMMHYTEKQTSPQTQNGSKIRIDLKHQEITNVSDRNNQQKMRNEAHPFLASDKLVATTTSNLEPNQKKVKREDNSKNTNS